MTSSGASVIDGLVIPSTSPVFLAAVAVHVAAGLACVICGAAAMLMAKRRGRHTRFGTCYYAGLVVVFVTAAGLSAVRWREDYPLFALASLSLAAASLARSAMRGRWQGAVRLHIAGMGGSYITLLTAFYVDNGPNLPVWKDLPPIAYWLAPSAIGGPIMVYALARHRLTRPPPRTTS